MRSRGTALYIEKPRRRRSQVHAVSTEPFRDKPRQSLKSLVCLDNSWGKTVRCPRTPETQAQQNAPRAWPRAWGHHDDDSDSSRDINCDNEDVTVIADD